MKYLTLIFTVVFIFSCSCKKNMQNHEKNLKKDNKSLDNAIKTIRKLNPTKEFVLIINKKNVRKNDVFPTVFYSIADAKNKKIVYKDIVPGGKVEWLSDYVLSVKSLLIRPKDMLTSKSNLLYKLNIKTLKKFK